MANHCSRHGHVLTDVDFVEDPYTDASWSETYKRAASERDRPLSFHWQVDPDSIAALGLPASGNAKHVVARNSIIAAALIGHGTRRWTSVSLNRNHYTGLQRYHGMAYTYTWIHGALNELCDLGLIDLRKVPPGNLGRQSVFQAETKLVESFAHLTPSSTYNPHEVIRLKDVNKDLMSYPDNTFTRRARRDQKAFNEVYDAATIVLDAPDVTWTGSPIKIDGAYIIPAQKGCYRVFNRGSFHLGGRSYGGFWQGLPKHRRAQLTIDGAPVERHDHAQLHPRMLYAERGLVIEGDAYAVSGFDGSEEDRDLVKVAFNILVNADSPRKALWSIADKMVASIPEGLSPSEQEIAAGDRKRSVAEKLSCAKDLFKAIEDRHDQIADSFGTGAGLRLQRNDSDMAAYVSRRALKEGIVALPVHDEFIASKGRQADRIKELTDESFDRWQTSYKSL